MQYMASITFEAKALSHVAVVELFTIVLTEVQDERFALYAVIRLQSRAHLAIIKWRHS